LDLLGVRYLYVPENRMPPQFRAVETDGNWTLWNLQKTSVTGGESFYFCGKPQTTDRKQIFEAFALGTADPAKNLFLDPQPISDAPKRHDSRFLEFRDDGDTSLNFPGTAPRDCENGYLVVRENGIPGWRAWINGGEPANLYLADGIFLCVPLPKEKSYGVVLRYEPASFRFGLFISLLALAGLLGLYGLRRSGGFGF
jgi:hypothetical protein